MRILIITILFLLSEAFAQQQSEVRKVDSLTKEKSIQLEAVELSRRMPRRHMLDNGIRIDKAEIRRTFKFLGALDPLNAIRTLPGVSSGGDLNSGLYIRGGENGHNLIAYNGVTLYNPHHLFGLFPLLNPELVNHVQFHNGAAPASLSGRLSAYILLESAAESFDSVKNELVFNATLLSADLTVKRKFGKGFFGEAQARKSFLNALVWPYVNWNSPTQYDIYDLNLNLYYRSQNGLTQLTGYQGEDKFRMEFNRRTVYQEMDWGNKLIGLKHRQQLGGGQSLMLGLSETQYNYELDLDYNSSGSNILLGNRVNSLQYDLRYKLQKKHSLELGYVGSLHRVRPVDVQWQAATEGQQLKDLRQRIQQHQFYAHSQILLSDRWKTQAGLAFVQYAARDINDV